MIYLDASLLEVLDYDRCRPEIGVLPSLDYNEPKYLQFLRILQKGER